METNQREKKGLVWVFNFLFRLCSLFRRRRERGRERERESEGERERERARRFSESIVLFRLVAASSSHSVLHSHCG